MLKATHTVSLFTIFFVQVTNGQFVFLSVHFVFKLNRLFKEDKER